MSLVPGAVADDIMFANTSSAENKRESVPQSDAGAFDMMLSAKASGLMYKHRCPLLLKLSIAGHASLTYTQGTDTCAL